MMKRYVVGASAGLLIAAGLITSAPAGAGCVYGGAFISKCDGPVQPDGSWERCVGIASVVPSGFGTHLVPVKQCGVMGPGRVGGDAAFSDPPVHLAD
ncbi:hypothetical protein EV589_2055 [Mycobacterium sp. BK558]|jgi:hypothetical protein|uniref:CDGP domain-containing protein n=3 Tax=Mycobacteriaceae TaxID=1762 RepID=A0A0J6VSZ4_MYCCU|nr:hypothetical protein MCHLDSM_04610 [Mycolicibacterium chlorophenolicum]KMO72587.1 hypothetical protein MCHUDSM44219_04880 [Mycolicibacterium chubuense]RZT17807.1 hypothetical protein EV589_2055 [Mycobacterium sp. BK558]SPX99288.1 Uncharacterised protein [Mycolicibacterium chubuense]